MDGTVGAAEYEESLVTVPELDPGGGADRPMKYARYFLKFLASCQVPDDQFRIIACQHGKQDVSDAYNGTKWDYRTSTEKSGSIKTDGQRIDTLGMASECMFQRYSLHFIVMSSIHASETNKQSTDGDAMDKRI